MSGCSRCDGKGSWMALCVMRWDGNDYPVSGPKHDENLKNRKAHPTEVTMLDLILENQKLKYRVHELERRLAQLEDGAGMPRRIG